MAKIETNYYDDGDLQGYSVKRDNGFDRRYFNAHQKEEAEAYYNLLKEQEDRERLIAQQKRTADETTSLRRAIEMQSRMLQGPSPQQIEAQRLAQEKLAWQKRLDDERAYNQQQRLLAISAQELARKELYIRKAQQLAHDFGISGTLTTEEANVFAICTENRYYGFDNSNLIVESAKLYTTGNSQKFWEGIVFFYGSNPPLINRILSSTLSNLSEQERTPILDAIFDAVKDSPQLSLTWLSSPFVTAPMLTTDKASKLGRSINTANANDFLRQASILNGNSAKIAFIDRAFSSVNINRCPLITKLHNCQRRYLSYKQKLEQQWPTIDLMEIVFANLKMGLAPAPVVEGDLQAIFGDLPTLHRQALCVIPNISELKTEWLHHSQLMEQVPDTIVDIESIIALNVNTDTDIQRFEVPSPALPLIILKKAMIDICKYWGRVTAYRIYLLRMKKENSFFSQTRKTAKYLIKSNKHIFKSCAIAHKGDKPVKNEIMSFLQKTFRRLNLDKDTYNTFYSTITNTIS